MNICLSGSLNFYLHVKKKNQKYLTNVLNSLYD